MRHLLVAAALLAAPLALAGGYPPMKSEPKPAAAAAAPEKAASEKKDEKFKLIGVAELEALQAATPKPVVYDANDDDTRKKKGIVPGAKLLTSYNKYDAAKELPADKASKLVFYCGSTKCTASHVAAERAVEAGYKDVSVFSPGIAGWKDAGKPVGTL